MATVVTHGAVQWTITEPVTQGTFVNGEPYVVVPSGTITVESYTPTPTSGRNGSMKNNMVNGTLRSNSETAQNGYDDRAKVGSVAVYSDANNIAHNGTAFTPFTLTANDVLITAESAASGSGESDNIDSYGILVVLASAPLANSFRPPWCGWDGTTFYNESDLNYLALPNLDPDQVAGEPLKSTYEAYIYQKSWTPTVTEWWGTRFHPPYMAGAGNHGYGQDIAQRTGAMGLLLCLDDTNSNKRNLLVGLVQYAIDNQGIIDDGGSFSADGGIFCGRLTPHLVASAVLDNADMRSAMGNNDFQETQQTFYVTQQDVDDTQLVYPGKSYTVYQFTQEDLNKPEWGVRASLESHRIYISDGWDNDYRDIAGGVTLEPALVMHLLNARGFVDESNALFDYAQRHLYYRQSRYADPQYYNGWDDGDSYGDGNTTNPAPFSSNESTAFATNMFLAFENASPVGLGLKPPHKTSSKSAALIA